MAVFSTLLQIPLVDSSLVYLLPLTSAVGLGVIFRKEIGEVVVKRFGRGERALVQGQGEFSFEAPPRCPKCSRTMVQRATLRGATRDAMYWGCPGYPDCRATRGLR